MSNSASYTLPDLQTTPQTIEIDRRIKRNTIAMVMGAEIWAIIGALKYSKRTIPGYLGAGVIGGVLGLVTGKIVGFLIHPND